MKVIGLTGGIGSGKSTVAAFLKELGAIVLDADQIGHDVLENDGEVHAEVVSLFGAQVLNAKSRIDRKKLADIVFKDATLTAKLNMLVHPVIYKNIEAILEDYRQKGVQTAVIEAPLLIEAGWRERVNEIWVTVAPKDVVMARLGKRGMTEDSILERMQLQMPSEEKQRAADVVIDTDIPLIDLKKTVTDLWNKTTVDTNRC
ncbi:MAG: dephospho-CoA kinase [Dehalococcoidales bacterium]